MIPEWDRCPHPVDLDQKRPRGVPPLLFNLSLHEGHGCPTELILRKICADRGYPHPGGPTGADT
ncbi:MAG: hypothetical protein J2P18_00680 [Nocardia sp.]|nr:hypothetical protein [Nocardia sp.]